MKPKTVSFISKRKEIRDLKKQLNSIREENRKLKNLSSIVVNNNMATKIIHLRNRVVLILKSIGNSFNFNAKRIEILNNEIEALKTENKALQLKKQNFDYMIQSLRSTFEPRINFNQSASYHSQGSVDRAMR